MYFSHRPPLSMPEAKLLCPAHRCSRSDDTRSFALREVAFTHICVLRLQKGIMLWVFLPSCQLIMYYQSHYRFLTVYTGFITSEVVPISLSFCYFLFHVRWIGVTKAREKGFPLVTISQICNHSRRKFVNIALAPRSFGCLRVGSTAGRSDWRYV